MDAAERRELRERVSQATLERRPLRQNQCHVVRAKADRLTGRQIDVLRGVADGETSDDTAHRLWLSSHTVRHHRKAIRERLGARSMAQAVAIGFRIGYLETP